MTLVNCPECNQPIATDAPQCPHCGHPLQTEKIEMVPARNYGWGTFIYLIIFLAGIFMLLEGKLTGIILLVIGILLIVARYKLWSRVGKRIK